MAEIDQDHGRANAGLTPLGRALVEGLVEFLDGLRSRHGYDVDTDQLIAAQHLLRELEARGLFPTENPSELVPYLGPLVCRSAVEQADFPRRFADWIRQLERLSEANPRADSIQDFELRPHTEEMFSRLQSQLARLRAHVLTLGGVASVLLVLANQIRPLRTIPTPGGLGGNMFKYEIELFTALLDPIQPVLIILLGAVVAYRLVAILSGLIIAGFLRQREKEAPPGERSRVFTVPVEVDPPKLMEPAEATRLARDFRRRRFVNAGVLDVPATTRATVRNAGLMTPVWGTRQVTPEYLILVDREGQRDQQAWLADGLIGLLESHDVLVDWFDFRGDPRACQPHARPGVPRGRPLMLRELGQKYPDHRLILFTDGTGLFDLYRGEFAEWSRPLTLWAERAILTPEPIRDWGPREAELMAEGFHVLPASPSGLAMLIERLQQQIEADTISGELVRQMATPSLTDPAMLDVSLGSPSTLWASPGRSYPEQLRVFPRRWLDRSPPGRDEVDRLVADLRRYLGESGYLWLSACAVYPAIHSEITRKIGERLRSPGGSPLLQTVPLTALARLPWFRHGTMPVWLRERLLEGLSPSQSEVVATTIKEILAQIGPDPTRGLLLEFSADRKGVLDRLFGAWIGRTPDSEDDDDPRTDVVFKNFLTGKKNRRSDFDVPRSLAGRFRELVGTKVLDDVLSLLNSTGANLKAGAVEMWRILAAVYDPREFWAFFQQLTRSDRRLRWRLLSAPSSLTDGQFLIYLQVAMTPRGWDEVLLEEVRAAFPGHGLLLIELGAIEGSRRDPKEIVKSLITGPLLETFRSLNLDDSELNVVLISDTLGSLLLRSMLLRIWDKRQLATSLLPAGEEWPIEMRPRVLSSNPKDVVTFLAHGPSPCGWIDVPLERSLPMARRRPLVFLVRAVDFYFDTFATLVLGRLLKSLRQDAPFVVDMSLRWTRLRQAGVALPSTILAATQEMADSFGPIGGWAPIRLTTYKNSPIHGRADRLRVPVRQLLHAYLRQQATPPSALDAANRLDPVVDRSIKKVVFVIASEECDLEWNVPTEPPTKVVELRYSFFQAVFYHLLPDFLARSSLSDGKFMLVYADLVAHYPEADISVVAHGFGAFLVARMLSRFRECRFDRVVLIGSALSRFFPWQEVLDRQQVQGVLNLPANQDFISGFVSGLYDHSRSTRPFDDRRGPGKRLGGGGFGPLSFLELSARRGADPKPSPPLLLAGGHTAGLARDVLNPLIAYAVGATSRPLVDARFLTTHFSPMLQRASFFTQPLVFLLLIWGGMLTQLSGDIGLISNSAYGSTFMIFYYIGLVTLINLAISNFITARRLYLSLKNPSSSEDAKRSEPSGKA